MGCCISKPPPRRRSPPNHPCRSPPRRPAPAFGKTNIGVAPQNATTRNPPPPPPLEEETVKEVLSETPLPQLQLPETPQPPPKLQEDGPETKILISKLEEAAEVVSEYSEMYSVSESLSTATTATTATDKRETEVTSRESREVRQRPKSRSPAKVPKKRPPYAGDLTGGGERRVAHRSPSPAKRSLASGVSGTGLGRVREQGRARTAASQRNVGPPSGALRRDTGETSRRRSSSPATRRAGEASAGATGRRSPAKWAGSAGDRSATGEGKTDSGAETAAETKSEEHNYKDTVAEQGNESLDNPLVSLECFIFL